MKKKKKDKGRGKKGKIRRQIHKPSKNVAEAETHLKIVVYTR